MDDPDQQEIKGMRSGFRWISAICLVIVIATAPPRGQNLRSPANIRSLLERQTQELMDAIAVGNRDPWQRYLHDDVVVTAEDGRTWRKGELINDLRPFPKEIWGKLKVTEFQTVLHGSTAIATYTNDEEEGYFGQLIRARYRVTDTWIETRDVWQLVASQVLALREDPPAIALPASKLDEYVGTYALTSEVTYTIRRDADQLTGERTGRKPEPLRVEVADYLFVPGQPRLRKVFQRNTDGTIAGFVERRESWDIAWRRLPSRAAQERPAIPEGVELIVPVAPQTIRMAGTTYLVHELHITNLLTVDVELLRVQVVAAAPAGGSIADHAIDDLAKRMGRPGLPRNHETPRVLAAGMRAVVYFWIDLAHASVHPASLRHRVELIIRRPSPVQATIEGGPAHVAKADVLVLAPPLRGGPWVTIYDPDLKGGHRTAIYTLDGRPRIPGRFAIDMVRLSAHGAIEPQSIAPKGDWNGYGSDVLAVADATVAAAADDVADNPLSGTSGRAPVPLENASGNYVALNLGDGRFAFYEHLKQGSIRVTSGQRVRRGDVLGQLGNSGSTSIGPHLHFHVSDAASLLGAEGLPYVFSTFEQLGSFESIAALVGGKPWQAGPGGRTLRALEFPAPNAVVRFH